MFEVFIVVVCAVVVANLISGHLKSFLKVIGLLIAAGLGLALCFVLYAETEFFGRLVIAAAYVAVMVLATAFYNRRKVIVAGTIHPTALVLPPAPESNRVRGKSY